MTTPERLVEVREKNGYTRKRLAQELQRPYRTITNYETGEREPGHEYIIEIAKKFGVSTDYLLGISDNPKSVPPKKTSLSDEAMKLAADFDKLDRFGKKTIRSIIDEELSRCIEQAKETAMLEAAAELAGDIMDKIIPFRRSYQPASAGTGIFLGPDEFETIYVLENNLTCRASFGVPVSGNSMEPDYHDGEVLLVERAEDVRIGEVGVFTIDGDGYVKQRGDGELISLNPAYDPIPMNESIRCSGRVIGILEPDWIVEK